MVIRKSICSFFCILLFSQLGISQAKAKVYHNEVFDEDIKSVQTFINTELVSIPILRLKSSDKLFVHFDDLKEDAQKNYHYKIIHCSREWIPSTIQEIEYLDGFSEEPLRDWEFSVNSLVEYTHYWLMLPNKNTNFKVSGNYILMVFDKGKDNKPVFTRRFCIVEDLVVPIANFVRPNGALANRSAHQFSLQIPTKDIKMVNPQREITVDIIQNGNWDTRINTLSPEFFTNNLLTFNGFGAMRIDANNEYRNFDLRTTFSRGRSVKTVDRNTKPISAYLLEDILNEGSFYDQIFDVNGNYHVSTRDFNSAEGFNISLPSIANIRNSEEYKNIIALPYIYEGSNLEINEKDLRADYVNTYFSVKSIEHYKKKVYLYGGLTNWTIDPRFELIYDDELAGYKGNFLLKQGFYDYTYIILDEKGQIDLKSDQGSWVETENDYIFLVYQRAYGTRYDKLVGNKRLNSLSNIAR